MRCSLTRLLACCVWLLANELAAQPVESRGSPLSLRASIKSSLLVSRFPDNPALFPDRDTTTGFWRFRLEPFVRLDNGMRVELALEHRFRLFSSATNTIGSGALPVEADAPYRIRRLDWQLASSSRAEWRAELDRASASTGLGAATLTVGRQAIGWGRGVLFGAVDLFSPFSPLEADREWRRGVDAVRADVRLADRISIDGVGAFGSTIDRSAVAARFRGYTGRADIELVGGRRARDLFAGFTTSAPIGNAEVHGELAIFRTPETCGSAFFQEPRSIAKTVVGGSSRLPIAHGVLLFAEYHYSGFGASSATGILPLVADRAFQERLARGDTQILMRHAVAVLASYDWSPELSVAGQWLQSPTDGSGVFVPTTTWTLSDQWSVMVSGYLPVGDRASGFTVPTQFGSSPRALFVQVRAYR